MFFSDDLNLGPVWLHQKDVRMKWREKAKFDSLLSFLFGCSENVRTRRNFS